MNVQESKTGRGWAMASMVVLVMDVIGFIGLAVMTASTKAKFGRLFTELLGDTPLPKMTMLLMSIPPAVYWLLFAGLVIGLIVKEKYIRNRLLTCTINIFSAVGGVAYLSVYRAAMFLPLIQIIQSTGKTN